MDFVYWTWEQVETDEHPYFKRIWNIRHVLNQNSPLLAAKMRRIIEENNGYWPEHLANHQVIHENVHFNDCIVSFCGTSNATGSTVHGQNVYQYSAVNVGYVFVHMLRVEKGRVVVENALLSDIYEQDVSE